MVGRRCVAVAAVLLLAGLPAAALAVDPDAAVASSASSTAGLAIGSGSGTVRVLGPDEIAQLPAMQVVIALLSEHGTHEATFEGPLLWAVLDHAQMIPAKARDQARHTVWLTGRDGYGAALALGEIAPDFEGKQVILALRMDGQPLGPEHLRLVVPGDKRGGRSVRDVVRIEVTSSAQPVSQSP